MKNTAQKERTALLRRFLRGSGRAFALCIFCGILLTLCDMLIPQIIRYAVDSVIGGEASGFPALTAFLRQRFWLLGVMLAVVGLLGALFRYYNNLFNAKAGETLVKTMRDSLYGHIQRLPWSWHQKNATGDIIQRCTSDVEVIKTFFQEQFVSVFRIVILIAFSIGCMAAMSLPLALVALAFVPIIVSYSLVFHNRIRERFALCDENEGILSTIAQENLTGVRVVRAFGREDFERQRFENQNQIYTNCWITLCRTLAWFWASGDMSSGLQVMSIVVLGSIFCVQGRLTPGEFIAFNAYNAMLVWPVRRLGRMISQMSKAGVSMDRLAYIMNSQPEQDAPGADTPPMDGDISFENVSFAYDEGTEVLHDISFTIPAGSSFGILGGTGSGKSSLMHLLCRLHEPGSGRITVGDRDIAAMQARHVRSQVGIVLQEPFLFSRTIGENIGICGISAEELRQAAVTACIHEDIMDFTAGYDTLVGERGVTLSGGQKQRVAMARTLSRRTPILIFDDSLSAVDTETDERIREALSRDLHGCTRIIISHRITTLMDCDCVLVLDNGSVAELDSPAELYARGGIYRRIYDMQMSLGEEEGP
ncbi:MAG: ABC transporter ATP-binding protein [Ruminococcaceae bacterium]|nr:ABC transporter ATP-binding protein [Oscillospiraceae bacterium]